jgi:type I restriction enzyme R subunit
MAPEQQARVGIDTLLSAAGWHVCNVADANIQAATGVAIREFPLNPGFGFADYLLYVNGKACGVIEAKKEGATLTGVELQSGRYAKGLPTALPAWRRPLPFVWESTGVETHFTNGLDPEPRARAVFAFFRPELLVQWLAYLPTPGTQPAVNDAPGTFLTRMRSMPKLVTEWGSGGAHYALWPAQIRRHHQPGKKPRRQQTQGPDPDGHRQRQDVYQHRLYLPPHQVWRSPPRAVLVDRGNLARQTKKEFDAYASPYNNYKFGEEYIVQHLQGNQLDTSARVVICTIQRMFSMLKGREMAEEADEESTEKH